MRKLVEEVRASLAPQLAAQAIDTCLDVPEGLIVMADRDMLRRAVLNLWLNAVDAMREGGCITVTAFASAVAVELEVADDGPGLAEDVLRRAFEPFFTTKNTGTGLGLAVVDRVMEVHAGSVSAQNCPEGGAAFTLRLPRIAMEAAA